MSNLAKSFSIQLTIDQDKAIENLVKIGYKKNSILRIALDEFLYKHYRPIIKESRKQESRKEHPDWVFD